MCQSVGVRCTSPTALVTRFDARSIAKFPVSTTAGSPSPARCPAERGAEASEKLVRSEGFCHVNFKFTS